MKTSIIMLFLFLLLLSLSLTVVAQVPAPQVPVTGNIGAGGVFPLLNHGTITLTSDADYTLNTISTYETTAPVLRIASSVTLSATRNIIHPSNVMGFQYTVENATTGGQAIVFKGTTGTGVTILNGQTMLVMSDGTNYISLASVGLGTNGTSNQVWGMNAGGTAQGWQTGGSMVWPPGTTAGVIPNYNGASGWGANYGTGNTIPANFLASIPYSQLTGTVPIWNQNTTGNAATSTNMSSSGSANQIWAMDSTGTNQGWQTPAPTGGPVYSQTFSSINMITTAGPIQLTGTGCAASSPWTCTVVSPTSDTSYRLNGTVTQVVQGVSCASSGSLQIWITYTDPDSNASIANANMSNYNVSATSISPSMTMGNGSLTTSTTWNILPLTIRVKNGTSLIFRAQQSVAVGSGCSPTPAFTLRFAAYLWP